MTVVYSIQKQSFVDVFNIVSLKNFPKFVGKKESFSSKNLMAVACNNNVNNNYHKKITEEMDY